MRARDANSNTVPHSDRDRTNEDNADCCGCTCEWWTDGRQTIFRQNITRTVVILLNLACKFKNTHKKINLFADIKHSLSDYS